MCYTANDSLLGYIINSISSVILYNISNDRQYKVMSLFLLFVGQMQIFDFAFWKNKSCSWLNSLITKLAITFNHLQPVVLFALQRAYGFQQSPLSLILFISYLAYGIMYNFWAFTNIDCTLPVDGVMKWKWNHIQGASIYYFLFLAYLFVASFNFTTIPFKLIAAAVTLVTFIVAHKTPILNISVGRIWCYYAALMPLVFISLKYFNLA
jgi:hypothetical protein